MNASPRATCLALLFALLGCREPPEEGGPSRAVIGPSGGTISSLDSVLTIAILPGALEEEVELFIETTNEPPDIFGQAYIVRPTPELLIDATITIRAPLPDDPSTAAVGAVDPDAFEAGQGDWVALPVLEIDEDEQRVTGLDDRISIFYGLLDGRPPGATTGDPTTGDPTGGGVSTGGDDDGTTSGDDGTTSGSATDSGETGDGSTGEPALSFATDVLPILVASCDCHTDGAPEGLDMNDAYANLVDVASAQVPALDRIEPGQPDESYMWLKLNDAHVAAGGTGNPMPAPTGGLDGASLATIEAWILDGAEP